MYIIKTIPGACGDIVTAVIDNSDSILTHVGTIGFYGERNLLKKDKLDHELLPSLFEQVAVKYKSISSQYHYFENNTIFNGHKFITIDVDSDELIDWCIDRLYRLWPILTFNKETLKEEIKFHNLTTNYKIKLSDILKGKLIDKLEEYKIPYTDSKLYDEWLKINTKKYPYNF